MFTGTLSIVRREAQSIVEGLGGIAGSSVNKNTDFLVVGEDYGSKFTTAQILSVKCIDEDEFWAMVTEAKELEGKILLTRAELENFDSISTEKWKYVFSQNPNITILTEEGLLDLLRTSFDQLHKDDIVEEDEEILPPLESMTYYNKESLEEWLQLDSIKPKLGSRRCPFCSHEIPYSINSNYWYCFNCEYYCEEKERGKHTCSDYEKLEIPSELGFYEKCKVCGTVKFVAYADIDKLAKAKERRNYVHSLEFAAETAAEYPNKTKRASIVDALSSEEREMLYTKFVARRMKGTAQQEDEDNKLVCPIVLANNN